MTIKLSDKAVDKYDPIDAIMEWWAAGKQHRRRGTIPYGRRCNDDTSLQNFNLMNSHSDSSTE